MECALRERVLMGKPQLKQTEVCQKPNIISQASWSYVFKEVYPIPNPPATPPRLGVTRGTFSGSLLRSDRNQDEELFLDIDLLREQAGHIFHRCNLLPA
jgi:hypothetical protein